MKLVLHATNKRTFQKDHLSDIYTVLHIHTKSLHSNYSPQLLCRFIANCAYYAERPQFACYCMSQDQLQVLKQPFDQLCFTFIMSSVSKCDIVTNSIEPIQDLRYLRLYSIFSTLLSILQKKCNSAKFLIFSIK